MQLQHTPTAEIIAMAPRLDEVINEFIGDQDIKSNSADLYRRTLKQYFKWVALQGLTINIKNTVNTLNITTVLTKTPFAIMRRCVND